MGRILLVDDSPHAQRMGERILSEEGYEVVAVSNADSALIRLEDVDPDVVVADTVMPGRTGYDICQYLRMSPRHKHVRVILTAGVLETMDDEQVKRVQADAALKKPFEASALLAAVKPLAEAAAKARAEAREPGIGRPAAPVQAPQASPFVAVVDMEQVKAAVTVALDGVMDSMADEIARRVIEALKSRKAEPEASPATAPAPVDTTKRLSLEPKPAEPPAAGPHVETVRRVTPLRSRSGSILGLDVPAEPRAPESNPPRK